MEDREKRILEKIKQEELIEKMQLEGIKQKVADLLIREKQYLIKDIEINPEFRLKLSNCEAIVSIDYVINLRSTSFMVIKCSLAIESWERYILAFARSVKDYQIPYAMITDGENAKIIDILNGSLISDSIHGLFSRSDAIILMKDFKKTSFPVHRLEKEKRIVYAFEGIKCSTDA